MLLNSQTHGSIPINPHNHENPNACSQKLSKIQNTRRRGGTRGTTTTEKQAPQKLQEVQKHKKIQKEQKITSFTEAAAAAARRLGEF
jgi:hypothetical protein